MTMIGDAASRQAGIAQVEIEIETMVIVDTAANREEDNVSKYNKDDFPIQND